MPERILARLRLSSERIGASGLFCVPHREGQKGFQVLPRGRIVGRTFGWMIRWRSLVRDYERRDVSTAMIHVAMGGASSSAETLVPDFPNRP
jgi:hypothetical protein